MSLFIFVGESIYVARVTHEDLRGTIPGGLIPSLGVIIIIHCIKRCDYEERRYNEYEVLVIKDRHRYYWAEASQNGVPLLAIQCGYRDKFPLFIAHSSSDFRCNSNICTLGGMNTIKAHYNCHGPFVGYHDVGIDRGFYFSWKGDIFCYFQSEVLCYYKVPKINYSIPSFYKWVNCYDREIPPGALQAGTYINGEPTYLGRYYYFFNDYPGQIIPSRKQICIGNDLTEEFHDRFTAFVCNDPANFEWVYGDGGDIPDRRVVSSEVSDHLSPEVVARTIKYSLLQGIDRNYTTVTVPKWADKETQLIGSTRRIGFSSDKRYISTGCNGHQIYLEKYEQLTYFYQPLKLTEICRHSLLVQTNGIPDYLYMLPMPASLAEYCMLTKEEKTEFDEHTYCDY